VVEAYTPEKLFLGSSLQENSELSRLRHRGVLGSGTENLHPTVLKNWILRIPSGDNSDLKADFKLIVRYLVSKYEHNLFCFVGLEYGNGHP